MFVCLGADEFSIIEAHNIIPLHPDAPKPVNGEPRVCFCGLTLWSDVRPQGCYLLQYTTQEIDIVTGLPVA